MNNQNIDYSAISEKLALARREREKRKRTKENLENRSEFYRGLLRGVDELQATYHGGMGLLNSALGDEEGARVRFNKYQREMEEASENPATVTDFFSTDKKTGAFGSVGNMGRYVSGTIGNALPSLAESVGAGIVGAGIGSMVVPGPDPADFGTVPVGFIGGVVKKGAIKKAIAETAKEYVKKGASQQAAKAMAVSAVQKGLAKRAGAAITTSQTTALHEGGGMWAEGMKSGIDNPVSALILGELSGVSEAVMGAVPDTLKLFAKSKGVSEVAKEQGVAAAAGYLWDAVKSARSEALQESFQEFLGSVNETINEPEKRLFTRQNFMKWAEAGAAGGIVGGAVGGAGAAKSAIEDLRRPKLSPEDQAKVDQIRRKIASFDKVPGRYDWAEIVNGDREDLTGVPSRAERQQKWEEAKKWVVKQKDQREESADSLPKEYQPDVNFPDQGAEDAIRSERKLESDEIQEGEKQAEKQQIEEEEEFTNEEAARARIAEEIAKRKKNSAKFPVDKTDSENLPDIGSSKVTFKSGREPMTVDEYLEDFAASSNGDLRLLKSAFEMGRDSKENAVADFLPTLSDGITDEDFVNYISKFEEKKRKRTDTKSVDKPGETKPVSLPTDITSVGKPAETKPMEKPTDTKSVSKPAEAKPMEKPTDITSVGKPAEPKFDDSKDKQEFDRIRQRLSNLPGPPRPHEWAEIVLGDKMRWSEAPKADELKRQWEDARAAFPIRTYDSVARKEIDKETLEARRDFLSKAKEGAEFTLKGYPNSLFRVNNGKLIDLLGNFRLMGTVVEQANAVKKGDVTWLDNKDSSESSDSSDVSMPKTSEEIEALPKYSIYGSISNGKKKYFVRGEGKRGGGDTIHDTFEDAQKEAELAKQRDEERKAEIKKIEDQEKAEKKKQEEYEASFGGFLSSDPKVKGRQLKVLSSKRRVGNKVYSLKELIEKDVNEGAVVDENNRLMSPDGSFRDSANITKIGIDYAKHLVASKPSSKAEKSPTKDSSTKTTDAVSVKSSRNTEETKDAPQTKKGGDPNEVQAEGRQRQAEAETKGQVSSKSEGQAAGESLSPDSSSSDKRIGGDSRSTNERPKEVESKRDESTDSANKQEQEANEQDEEIAESTKEIVEEKSVKIESEPINDAELDSLIEAEFKKQLGLSEENKSQPKEEKPDFVEIKNFQNKLASRKIIATFGNKSVALYKNKIWNYWSIENDFSKEKIASGIEDLVKAKKIASLILSEKYDPYFDEIIFRFDPQNLALSNEQLAKYMTGRHEDRAIETLKTTGWYTDGRILVKVSEKDKESIFANVKTKEVNAKAFKIEDHINAAKELMRYQSNQMSVVGFRGGQISDREVVLQSKMGGLIVLDKKYHDTIMKKHPDAKMWGDAPALKVARGIVAYSVNDEVVAVAMPLEIKNVDKNLTALLNDTYEYPPQNEPKSNLSKKTGRKDTTAPKTKLKLAAEQARKEADDLWKSFLEQAKSKLGSGLDPELANLAVKIVLSEIKANTLTFGAFVEQSVIKAGPQLLPKIKRYLERAWEVAYRMGMVPERGGTFDDYIKEKGDLYDRENNINSPRNDDSATLEEESSKGGKTPRKGRNSGKLRSGSKRGDIAEGTSSDDAGSKPDADTGGNRQGISSPAGLLSNYRIGEKPDWLSGGAITKLNRNIEAIEVMNLIESENRHATPEEQEIIAQYTGWGHLKQFFIRESHLLSIKARDRDEWNKKAFEQLDSVVEQWVRSTGKKKGRTDEQIEDTVKRELALNKYRVRLAMSMSPRQYEQARKSTRYSHYTDPSIARSIWKFLERVLPEAGKLRVLEPSEGSGIFWGTMPDSMFKRAEMHAIDLDPSSSRVAKHLYPSVRHLNVAYQESPYPADFFDIAISNVPFNANKVIDAIDGIEGLSLHNYYFAKTARKLREGGVAAFITTHFTMDALSPEQRKAISKEGMKFLGAVRLNSNAFGKIANTKVTTDIIVMQKVSKDTKLPNNNNTFDDNAVEFSVPFEDFASINVEIPYHPYFEDESMIAGKITANGKMRGKDPELTVESTMTPEETAEFIDSALAKIPFDKDLFISGQAKRQEVNQEAEGTSTLVPEHLRDLGLGKLAIDGDRLVVRMSDDTMTIVDAKFSDAKKARAKKWFAIRDALSDLNALQTDENATDEQIEEARSALNKAYDDFVGKFDPSIGAMGDYTGYKPLNTTYNKSMFADDFMSANVLALEKVDLVPTGELDKNGNEKKVLRVEKADIFRKRNQWPIRKRPKPKTIKDAVAQSLFSTGGIDIGFMADILGVERSQVERDIEEFAFKLPNNAGWELKEVYLSGNIAEKLSVAEAAMESDPYFVRNVNALKEVLPVEKSFEQISFQINSPFIPEKILADFVSSELGLRDFELRKLNQETGGGWLAVYDTKKSVNKTAQDLVQYAVSEGNTIKRTGFDLLVDMLAGRPTVITYKDADGRTYIDVQLTNLAKTKRADLQRAFDTFIRSDADRMKAIEDSFNSKLTGFVTPEFPDWVISLDGMSQVWKDSVYKHQRKAIAKIALGGNTMLVHKVGFGKTLSAVAGIMEQRRLGIARKPVVVVPNHLTGQWALAFFNYYPSARVLAPTSDDFSKSKRQATMNRIMTGDWDAVIIPESSFKKLPMSSKYVEDFFNKQISLVMAVIDAASSSEDKNPRSIAELENIKERLENTMKKYLNEAEKDPGPFFDEMGIDSLTVDEAHNFKNLPFYTQNTRIAGINPSGSQKAFDMLMKTDFINEITGGRNLTFLTGTPISNSMTEAWVMQRYLMPEAMKQAGVFAFDDWKNTFGAVVEKTRVNTIGTGFRTESRFQEFVNIDSLSKMIQQVADVQMVSNDVSVPPIDGGKPEVVVVPASDAMKSFMLGLAKRSENMPDDPQVDNMLVVMGAGSKAAIDFRLIDAAAMPKESAKLNACADSVAELYNLTSPFKGTQIIWSDRGVPKKAKQLTPEMKQLGQWMLDEVQSKPLQIEEVVSKWKEMRTGTRAMDELRRFMAMALQDMQITEGTEEDEDVFRVNIEGEPNVYIKEILDVDPNIVEQAAPPWNVYSEMRNLLVARGVKKEDIAFVHDYKTEAQKKDLFANVRSGKVRVLIASTPKLGTGANIQDRLVAAHHLDVPWRPADIEQRDGRIVRMGNLVMTIGANIGLAEQHGIDLKGVKIRRYVTEGSIDARYYDTNEMKAAMLQDFWTGNPGVSMDELGATMLSMSEMKAAAVANPLLKEKIELESQLIKLNEEYRGALQSNTQTRQRLAQAEQALEKSKINLEEARKYVKEYQSYLEKMPEGKTVGVEIDGQMLFSPEEVGSAIERKLHEIGRNIEVFEVRNEDTEWKKENKTNSKDNVTIGTVLGQPLRVTVEGGFRNKSTGKHVPANSYQEKTLKKEIDAGNWERSYFNAYFRIGQMPGVRTLGTNPAVFLSRIQKHIEPAPNYIEDHERSVKENEKLLSNIRKLYDSLVQPDDSKIKELQQRLEDISNQLGDDSDDQIGYWTGTEDLVKILGERAFEKEFGRVDSSEGLIGYVKHPEHGNLGVFNRAGDTRPPKTGMVWVEGNQITIGYVEKVNNTVLGLDILKPARIIGRIAHPEHGVLNVFDRKEGEVKKPGFVWVESEDGNKAFGYQPKSKNMVMGQQVSQYVGPVSWPSDVKQSTTQAEIDKARKNKSIGEQIDDMLDEFMQTDSEDVNTEFVSIATDLAIAAYKAGIERFDKFVAFAVSRIGEKQTRRAGAYLRIAAEAVEMKGIRQTKDVLGSPNITKDQLTELAKQAFPMLSDEMIKEGVEIMDRLNLTRKVGFAPFGSPVPENREDAKGWTQFITATRAVIGATKKADISTLVHEIFHPVRKFVLNKNVPVEERFGITDEEIKALEDYAGVKNGEWTREAEEKAAKAWEQYWFEGKSPNNSLRSLFEKISRWMHSVYKSIKSITGAPLPKEVEDLFDKLVSAGEKVTDMESVELQGSIMKEIVNANRLARDVPLLADVSRQTQQQWIDEASRMLSKNPMLGDQLVKELQANARILNNVEVAVMQIYYRQVLNRFSDASDRMFRASDEGDFVEKAKLATQVDLLSNTLTEIEDAAAKAGREWGRAGVARQIVLAKDFSLAGMMRKARIANGGNPLSKSQTEEIAELYRKIEKLEAELAKAEQEKLDLERAQNIDRVIADNTKTQDQSVQTPSRIKAVNTLKKFASQFASLFAKNDDDKEILFAQQDDPMLDAAMEVVQAYVDAGTYSFGEFISIVQNDIGGKVPNEARAAFKKAWDLAVGKGFIPVPNVDENDAVGLSRLARDMARTLIESGIRNRDDIVDGVHLSLMEIVPKITRRETMDAISGYGQFFPLSENPIDEILRDIKGQLLQLAKLEDMRQGIAPAATGYERRKISDEERRLIAEVNEAKRRGGYVVLDEKAQLRTALAAAKTATRNRIKDLQYQIDRREKIVRTKTELVPDEELIELRKEKAALLEIYREMFPKPKQTEQQRIAASERALDMVIASLERQIKTGDVTTDTKSVKVSTPEIEAKRDRIKALRAQREVILDLKYPNRKAEQSEKAYKAYLLNLLADYQERIANREFEPRPKKQPRNLSQEEVDLKMRIKEVKTEFFRKAREYRLENMSPAERAWDYTKETANLSRALMTTADLSAVFKQGGTAVFSHPVLAKEAAKEMLGAMLSAKSEFETAEAIRQDPMYQFAIMAGLEITEEDGAITKQEEAFAGRWAREGIGKQGTKLNEASRKILTPVTASARAYITFLNGIRFRLFKHFVSNLGKGGQVTLDEAKVLAMFINVSTGRSKLGPAMKWAESLNMVFFAPRYVLSRFQYLTLPFWLMANKNVSGRVKKTIAMEYARHAVGVASFLTLAVALGSLMAGDDEEAPTVELDPRSSDFMKLKIGETRIDPMSGFSQVITFISRVVSGQKKTSSGEIVDLRGPGVKYGQDDTADVIANFVRTKLAPIPGAAVDIVSGKNVVGQEVTPIGAVANMFVPLSLREIKDTMVSRGIPEGTAISLLSLLGMGVSTYGPKIDFLKASEAERIKMMEKEDVVKNLKSIGIPFEEARRLLIKNWEQKRGSAREVRNGAVVYKEGLSNRLKELRQAYAD